MARTRLIFSPDCAAGADCTRSRSAPTERLRIPPASNCRVARSRVQTRARHRPRNRISIRDPVHPPLHGDVYRAADRRLKLLRRAQRHHRAGGLHRDADGGLRRRARISATANRKHREDENRPRNQPLQRVGKFRSARACTPSRRLPPPLARAEDVHSCEQQTHAMCQSGAGLVFGESLQRHATRSGVPSPNPAIGNG
jgi:hypothetical protein